MGTVVVDESEGELRVAIKLSDGTILPFTPQAARQLEIAGSNITSLHLRQGVFLTAEIASTDGYDPVRKVVEVYFEGE